MAEHVSQIPMRLRYDRLRKLDELNTPQRLVLQSFVQHSGYELFLDMVMYEIARMETELHRTEPGKRDEILARFERVTAAWELFEAWQKRLEAEINAVSEVQER